MDLNKTIQVLKTEVETIKKTQCETNLEIGILGKKSEKIDRALTTEYKKWKGESQVQKIP
jgi:prefoldin subunit 5